MWILIFLVWCFVENDSMLKSLMMVSDVVMVVKVVVSVVSMCLVVSM